MTASNDLIQAIDTANDGADERTLSVEQVIDAVSKLLPGEHAFLHGGHVTTKISHFDPPPRATVAVAWRDNRGVAYVILRRGLFARPGGTGFANFKDWKQPADMSHAVLVEDPIADAKRMLQIDCEPSILADALEEIGHPSARVLRATISRSDRFSAADLRLKLFRFHHWTTER